MTQPTKKSSESSPDWQLIAAEWKVMQEYSCHDGKAGLSLKDVQHFKKSNPELFEEMFDAYSPSKGPVKFTAKGFLERFGNQGAKNIRTATSEIFKSFQLDLSNWEGGRSIRGKKDLLSMGVFHFMASSKTPLDRKVFERAVMALVTTLENYGIFSVAHLRSDKDTVRLELPITSCKKPKSKKGIPNV